MAEHRSVTVRGVSERNVTADLATWSVNFSYQGTDLGSVQQSVDQQARAVRAFFQRAGFRPDEVTDTRRFAEPRAAEGPGRQAGRTAKADRQPLDSAADQRRDEGT